MKPSSAMRLHARSSALNAFGTNESVRAGVDVLDDRILLRRIEVRRPDDDAVDVGLAVAPLGDEDLRRPPAGLRAAR